MSGPEVWPDEVQARGPTASSMAAINSASVWPISRLPAQRLSSGSHISASEPAKMGAVGHPLFDVDDARGNHLSCTLANAATLAQHIRPMGCLGA
jgi:hypothetical protein